MKKNFSILFLISFSVTIIAILGYRVILAQTPDWTLKINQNQSGQITNRNDQPLVSFVESNGYVGIGIPSPTQKLDVRGNAYIGGAANITGGTTIGGNATIGGSADIGKAIIRDISNTVIDVGGGYPWSRVGQLSRSGFGGSRQAAWLPLNTTRAVLGIQITGNSSNGGYCVAGVPKYFLGVTGKWGSITNLDLINYSSWNDLAYNYGAQTFPGGSWIFETTAPGKTLSGPAAYTGNFGGQNRALALNYIPPGNNIYVSGWTLYGGYLNCYVDVIYGNP